MNDEAKTEKQLIDELKELRREVAGLQQADARNRHTLEMLQKSEAFFRAISQNCSDIIVIVNQEGIITYASPSVEACLGYKPEELVDKQAMELIAPGDMPRAKYAFNRALLTKDIISNTFQVLHKDGSLRILEGVGKNLLDDPVVAGFVMNARDVTEQKLAEDRLAVSHERLLTVLNNIGAEVHITDMETYELLFVNRNVEDIYGNVVGQVCWKVVQPEQTAPCPFCSNKYLVDSSGKATGLRRRESRNPLNGRWYHIHEIAIPWTDRRLVKLEMAFDITVRKKDEDYLRHLKDCFLSFSIDPLENINRMTALCGELMGATCALYNRLEGGLLYSLGRWHTPPDYVPEDQPAGHICYDVICKGGDELFIVRDLPATSYFVTDPNVARYNLKTYIGKSVMFAGAPVGSLCLVFQKDFEPDEADRRIMSIVAAAISIEEERRQAMHVLRASENFVRKILDTVDEGFIVIDKDLRILTANAAYCSGHGGKEGEIIGRHCYEVSHHISRPCYEEGEECPVRRAFETGEQHATCHRHTDAQGGILHVEVKAFPIKDEAGAVASVIETINNITAKHLLEEERLKAEKMAAIGTLAGGIAHDFNNLLQGVFGYISMAKMTLDQKERSLAMLEQAEKALHLSVGLTNQLLTFSKGGKPVKKKVELRPVIDNAVKFALSGSSVDYRLSFAKDLWMVESDEGQIGQVIQNLALNADQAMPLGGTITITVNNIRMSKNSSPPALKEGNYVEIVVQDSGIGIPEQFLPKIFDPYFTTKEKGSGLGLATSYSIVRNHGGAINVSSEIGKGTRFSLYLPAVDGETEPLEGHTDYGAAQKGKILVMDDEQLIRDVAGELIKALGHEVAVAAHGEAAIEAYNRARAVGQPFDLVILDLTIRGGLGGLETKERLLAIDPEVKLVVSSGYSDDSLLSDHRMHGFCKCLRKPYRLEELRDLLDLLLN